MRDRLISADALKREMWRRCGETDIETDKGRAKWDSGLWIRYKVFEECIADAPTVEAEPTFEQLEEYCRKRCLVVVDGALFNEMKSRWSAEPIVRCKDCNHFGEADDKEPKYHECKYFSNWSTAHYMLESDYCSCAERADEVEE